MLKLLIVLQFAFISLSAFALPVESGITYKGSFFSYFSSHDLKTADLKVERVVLSIHGSERNANTYYNSIEAMAKKYQALDKTILIAPHFKVSSDPLLAKELSWDWEGWLRGDESLNNYQVTSFDLMDYIIGLMTDKTNFPNLKEIVLTGHSAGGQLVQRYAAGTSLDEKYKDVKFRYVVANPGSYLYLTNKRPFKVAERCNFNDYKFGLDHLNSYMDRVPKAKIISQYLSKNVIYFLGESDNIAEGIDQSCPAQYQGKTRLERGQSYKAQLDGEFSQNQHKIITVPNVGHTQYGMYTSELGQKVLFQEL
jgi:hypothetical protein